MEVELAVSNSSDFRCDSFDFQPTQLSVHQVEDLFAFGFGHVAVLVGTGFALVFPRDFNIVGNVVTVTAIGIDDRLFQRFGPAAFDARNRSLRQLRSGWLFSSPLLNPQRTSFRNACK